MSFLIDKPPVFHYWRSRMRCPNLRLVRLPYRVFCIWKPEFQPDLDPKFCFCSCFPTIWGFRFGFRFPLGKGKGAPKYKLTMMMVRDEYPYTLGQHLFGPMTSPSMSSSPDINSRGDRVSTHEHLGYWTPQSTAWVRSPCQAMCEL